VPVAMLPDGNLQVGGKGSPVKVTPSKDDPDFADKVISDYQKWSSTPEGQQTLADMQNKKQTATGQRSQGNNSSITTSGDGHNSTVEYNPDNFTATNDPDSMSSDQALGTGMKSANESQ